MLSPSSLRKIRWVATSARPPAMATSMRVAISGIRRLVAAIAAPATQAASGSVLVRRIVLVMLCVLQKVGEQMADALDERRDGSTGAEQGWIDHQRNSRRHDEGRTFAGVEQELDGSRRKAQLAQPGVAVDRRDMLVAVIRVRAAAAGRRHEPFCDQVANLAFRQPGECGQLVDVHHAPLSTSNLSKEEWRVKLFLQRSCRKPPAISKPGLCDVASHHGDIARLHPL